MKTKQITVELIEADDQKVGMCFCERVSEDLSCDRFGVRKAYIGVFPQRPERQTNLF